MSIAIRDRRVKARAERPQFIYGDTETISFEISGHAEGDRYEFAVAPDRDVDTTAFILRECSVNLAGTLATVTVEFWNSLIKEAVNGREEPLPCWMQLTRIADGGARHVLLLDSCQALPAVTDEGGEQPPSPPQLVYYTKEQIDAIKARMDSETESAIQAARDAAGAANRAETAAERLPTPTPSDLGRVPTVNAAGGYDLATPSGSGDMTKAVYDPDDDGKVTAAESADSVPWDGVTGKPTSFPPTSHTHTEAEITDLDLSGYQQTSEKGVAGGYAGLDANGKVDASNLPEMDYLPLAGGTLTGGIVALSYSSTAQMIPASATTATLSDGVWTHSPNSTPTYTLPAITDSTVTHQILVRVAFSASVLSCVFQDSDGNTIAWDSTPTIAAGDVYDFLCEFVGSSWVIMPLKVKGA